MKFKVIDPNGVYFGGKHLAKGKTLVSEPPHGAHVLGFLHFKQVEEATGKDAEEADEEEPEAPASRGRTPKAKSD